MLIEVMVPPAPIVADAVAVESHTIPPAAFPIVINGLVI